MPNGFKWLIHLKNMVGQTILDYRYRHKRTASHPQAMVNWPPRTSGPPVCIDELQLQHTTPPHTGSTKSLHGCAGMACRLALLKVSYLYLWPSHLTLHVPSLRIFNVDVFLCTATRNGNQPMPLRSSCGLRWRTEPLRRPLRLRTFWLSSWSNWSSLGFP